MIDLLQINGIATEKDETTAITDQKAPTTEAKRFIGHNIPEHFLKKAGLFEQSVGDSESFQPLYELSSTGECIGKTNHISENSIY